MSTVHDYAGCQVEVCVQCDSYADRYSAGKTKAYAEIRSVPASGHSQAYQCRPCSAVRDSIRAVVGLDQGGLRPKWAKMLDKIRRQHQQAQRPAEAQHLRDCAGPGCGATCTCWCHAQEERAFETENRRALVALYQKTRLHQYSTGCIKIPPGYIRCARLSKSACSFIPTGIPRLDSLVKGLCRSN